MQDGRARRISFGSQSAGAGLDSQAWGVQERLDGVRHGDCRPGDSVGQNWGAAELLLRSSHRQHWVQGVFRRYSILKSMVQVAPLFSEFSQI
jgi:hypothetical protein